MLPRLAALLAFTRELESRLATAGITGLAATLTLRRRLTAGLDVIPAPELARMVAATQTLAAQLETLVGRLASVRRLKTVVEG